MMRLQKKKKIFYSSQAKIPDILPRRYYANVALAVFGKINYL